MQTAMPFLLEILILCKRVTCLMNTLNDFTVVQIIYESNMVQRECYNLVPSEIQYPCKQQQSLCQNYLRARELQNQEGK